MFRAPVENASDGLEYPNGRLTGGPPSKFEADPMQRSSVLRKFEDCLNNMRNVRSEKESISKDGKSPERTEEQLCGPREESHGSKPLLTFEDVMDPVLLREFKRDQQRWDESHSLITSPGKRRRQHFAVTNFEWPDKLLAPLETGTAGLEELPVTDQNDGYESISAYAYEQDSKSSSLVSALPSRHLRGEAVQALQTPQKVFERFDAFVKEW